MRKTAELVGKDAETPSVGRKSRYKPAILSVFKGKTKWTGGLSHSSAIGFFLSQKKKI